MPPSVRLTVCLSVCLSVCPSHYLLNHWVEFYQSCYITSSHGKGVQEQHYFSVCWSSIHFSYTYLLLNHRAEVNHTCYIMVRISQSNIIFLCICHPSICLSRYLLLNNWGEFNQTCYIISPHGKGVQEQHFFSMHPSSVHLSVTLSPPKPLGGIQPNLLHHLP